MTDERGGRCTAFAGYRLVARGELADVVRETKRAIDGGESSLVLLFDEETSTQLEIDFRGTIDDVLHRLTVRAGAHDSAPAASAAASPRGPGRPKLGVVAREVTLLPRHWDWLNSQTGGASVALRKLVEDARRSNAGGDRIRKAQESAYRFMSAMAGNEAGFEQATRALFAGDAERFASSTEAWPIDVRDHARGLAAAALESVAPTSAER